MQPTNAASIHAIQHTTGYAPVNGLTMYYEIHGQGDPLVLIHGGGSTIESNFENVLPLFARSFMVIAVELQAHGRTSDRDAPESFAQDADDVAGLLAHLRVPKAHILGFSNGGSTAMQIAIRHPALVDRLVVMSAMYKRAGMLPGFFDGLQQATLADMPEPLQTHYLKVGTQQGLQVMFERDKARMLQFTDRSDDDLRSIKAKALIIAGSKDVVTIEHTVEIARNIPGAELMIIPGNHGSFIGEVCSAINGSNMPAITVGIIEEFLKLS